MAYPLETVLAEKLETILSRATLNSRMRDFYDIRILQESLPDEIDCRILAKALTATAEKRGSLNQLNNAESVLCAVEKSPELRKLWETYRKKNKYAEEYTWDGIMHSVKELSAKAGLQVTE